MVEPILVCNPATHAFILALTSHLLGIWTTRFLRGPTELSAVLHVYGYLCGVGGCMAVGVLLREWSP